MNNIATGKKGEEIAKEYLMNKGYKIIESNKHLSRYSELDIIAMDKIL